MNVSVASRLRLWHVWRGGPGYALPVKILLILLCAFPAAAELSRVEALAAIERLGGVVTADGALVRKVDLSKTATADADLAILAALPELLELDLRFTKVTDDGVGQVARLKNLRFLNLFRTVVSDRGLQQLSSLTELDTLLIGGTKITSGGLAALRPLSHLRKVSVFDTAVDDAGVEHLKSIASLRVLLIGKSKITENGSAALTASIPELSFTEQ